MARRVVESIDKSPIGEELHPIVDVAQGEDGDGLIFEFNEKDLRVIRFCLNRFAEE